MISIIIPTLNEERSLPSLLNAIRQQTVDHEVIVVDGGSQDRTVDIARDHCARTLISRPGRGAALCLGAANSGGEVLLFLHADSTLQPGALDRIDEVLSTDAKIIGGNFRLVFDGDTCFSRRLTRFCALIRALGHYYGDFRYLCPTLCVRRSRRISSDPGHGRSGVCSPATAVRTDDMYQAPTADHLFEAFRRAARWRDRLWLGRPTCAVLARCLSRPTLGNLAKNI